MATRIGIELSPAACRIVEIEAGPAWGARPRETRVRSFAVLPPSGPETQATLASLRGRQAAVVIWAGASDHRQVMVPSGSYEAMRKAALKGLAAAGVQTSGMWSDIAPARRQQQEQPGRSRRPVIVTLASAAAMRSALKPVTDAGIHVRTVLTPAAALGALAHLRHASGEADAIEAYIALDQMTTCVALVHDGMLMAARNLAWGYLDDRGALPRRREDIATRLVAELSELFESVSGSGAGSVSQICVCGGLAELRSMTAPLMERLDVEVEPLDSLFGIDKARLPAPADEFRERSAALRLAWAAVVDTPPPINLLRGRRRLESKAVLGRAAVVAGMAAGLSVGWAVERSPWWRATDPKPVTQTVAARAAKPAVKSPAITSSAAVQPVAVQPVVSAPRIARPIVTPPAGVGGGYGSSWTRTTVSKPAVVVTPGKPAAVVAQSQPAAVPAQSRPSAVVSRSKPVAVVAQNTPPAVVRDVPPPPIVPHIAEPAPSGTQDHAVSVRPGRTAQTRPAGTKPAETKPTEVKTAAAKRVETPIETRRPEPKRAEPRSVEMRTVQASAEAQRTAAPILSPPMPLMPRTLDEPAVRKPPVAARPPAPERAAPERAEPKLAIVKTGPAEPETALPFDAVLGSILYSPDRRLAIVDGRIVAVGDEVRGARIVDITSGAVLFRDAQGRLRRLTLGIGAR